MILTHSATFKKSDPMSMVHRVTFQQKVTLCSSHVKQSKK